MERESVCICASSSILFAMKFPIDKTLTNVLLAIATYSEIRCEPRCKSRREVHSCGDDGCGALAQFQRALRASPHPERVLRREIARILSNILDECNSHITVHYPGGKVYQSKGAGVQSIARLIVKLVEPICDIAPTPALPGALQTRTGACLQYVLRGCIQKHSKPPPDPSSACCPPDDDDGGWDYTGTVGTLCGTLGTFGTCLGTCYGYGCDPCDGGRSEWSCDFDDSCPGCSRPSRQCECGVCDAPSTCFRLPAGVRLTCPDPCSGRFRELVVDLCTLEHVGCPDKKKCTTGFWDDSDDDEYDEYDEYGTSTA